MRKLIILLGLLMTGRLFAQVNLQSGAATFSIPIFNWQDDKSRLNAAVALSYNSGNGLRVNDVASNVGQGWNLIAGGVITRMQVGEPDDQMPYNGNGTPEDITKYPAGYLYDNMNASQGVPAALTKYPIYGDENHVYKNHNQVTADKELDYFSFQFNGFSGFFVLDKNNTNTGVFLSDNHMKVWFTRDETMATNVVNSGIRTSINAFFIQDENGLIYRFSQIAKSKTLKTGYCDANQTEALTEPHFRWGQVYYQSSFDKNDLVNPYVINNWYLTDITDALTGRKISLNYELRNINASMGTSIASYSSGYSVVSFHKTVGEMLAISSISYPDGHAVYFNYGKSRVDLNGDKCLSSIDVQYQNRYLSSYQLQQSYFLKNRYGNPVSDYQKSIARLCLLSVKQIGVDLKGDNQPYLFDYYIGSDNADDFVPPPFYHIKDVWGFYNGNNSVTKDNQQISLTKKVTDLNNNELNGLCYLNGSSTSVYLNPKAGYAKNGLIKQIVYPTGGAINYQYDQNTGVFIGNSQNGYIGGVHVSSTSTTDGGYQNGCDNPLITHYNYIDSYGNSSLWGLETPNNMMTTYNHYSPESKYYHYKFPFGECKYHFQYPGILSQTDRADLSMIQNIMQSMSTAMDILNIVSTIMDVVNVIGPESGPFDVVAIVLDVIGGLVDIALTCFTNQDKDSGASVYYNTDLNSSNPLPTQFWRVEVVQNNGESGKTVQEFTSSVDFPIWEPNNSKMSMKQRFGYGEYGLLKKSIVYDVNNNKIKETENVYDTMALRQKLSNVKLGTSFYSVKALILKSQSQRNTDWADPNVYGLSTSYQTNDYFVGSDLYMKVEVYDMYKSRILLSDSYDRTFKPGDVSNYVETHTHYDYNPNNYQVAQMTTMQSNGDINYKNITYDCDYYDNGVLTSMTNKNILSVPVSSYTRVQKSGSTAISYLGENVTEFATVANGDIKVYRTLQQRFAQPVSSMSVYNPNASNNNSIYKQVQILSYDGNSDLVGMSDEGSHVVSNIYGYNSKYVIASVINADPASDKSAYTSFEVSGEFGGWSLSGSNSLDNSTAITGSNSFNMSGNTLTASGLNTGKSYRLSFWSNGSVNIAGATASLVVSNNSIAGNGFTYYEYTIAAGASNISLSGSGNIDELRLYPTTARMRTVSYDPLIGKTSECDENNRITYYSYDELARLRFIKDEKGNIVKMYEYNTVANKQSGCPTTYSNHLINEIFTKSDCSSNQQGTNITYTIPSGKYTSTISQADADRQADDELNTYGQSYANNNGGCQLKYYNQYVSKDYTTHSCNVGSTGGIVTYAVPANKYFVLTSQQDADSLAWKEVFANGQSYANNPVHANCITDTAGNWQVDDTGAQLGCGTGLLAGHRIAYMRDINPNSATYNTWQWKDAGVDNANCPISTVAITGSSTINANFQIVLTNQSTGATYSAYVGYTPSTSILLYNVPAGTYNVNVYPGISGGYSFQIGGYWVTGSGAITISGVSINTDTDGVILIDPIGQTR